MDSHPRRSSRVKREPGVGMLATRLLLAVQDELYERLEQKGYGELTRLHGAVLANLDQEGTRPSELARRAGRHKQIVGRLADELEALGYVYRSEEKGDRRAKLIVPTERGRDVMRLSDQIMRSIERRQAVLLGRDNFEQFLSSLRTLVDAIDNSVR